MVRVEDVDELTESESSSEQRRQSETFEDIMDISSSSADEGQIISTAPTPPALQEREQSSTSSYEVQVQEYEPEELSQDEYEPEVSLTAQPPEASSMSESPGDDMAVDAEDEYEPDSPDAPVIPQVESDSDVEMFSPDSNILPQSYQVNPHGDEYLPNGDYQDKGKRSTLEQVEILDDSPPDDDYEPPEPSYTVDNKSSALQHEEHLGSPVHTSNEVQARASPKEAPLKPNQAPIHPTNGIDGESLPQVDDAHQVVRTLALRLVLALIQTPSNQVTSTFSHFTPYESPLSQFNSYRFHPEYVKNVPGGFRSLTYSHRINPHKQLCRWELAGGICNDTSCEDQHFRDMSLTGTI